MPVSYAMMIEYMRSWSTVAGVTLGNPIQTNPSYRLLVRDNGIVTFSARTRAVKATPNDAMWHCFNKRGYVPERFKQAMMMLDAAANEDGYASIRGLGSRCRVESMTDDAHTNMKVQFNATEYSFP